MKNTSKPIIFFGTENFSLTALQALVGSGFNVRAVVTKPDAPRGRGNLTSPPVVKKYAASKGIDVWQPDKLQEIAPKIAGLHSPVGVLVSYGKIIPASIINLFSPGIINIHPSLLPQLRGPSPIESAIIQGYPKTGVSIMNITSEMDAGPVYIQKKITMNGRETGAQLYTLLGEMGAKLLADNLQNIIDGVLHPVNQNHAEATFTSLIKKSDGIINWQDTAKNIEAKIRAYSIWPQCKTKINNVEVIITKAMPTTDHFGAIGHVTVQENKLYIDASDYALRILALKPVGKKEMPVQAFLAGYKNRL